MSSDEKQKIRVMLMLEIIGKPPEHLITTLEDLIKKLGEEKGVIVKSKDIKEPKPMAEKIEVMDSGEKKKSTPPGDFYTTFAEIEIEIEEITSLAYLMFMYMPAHVEIISPELIALTNNGWNEMFNELVRRLHGYNEVARVLQVEKEILAKKVKELMGKEGSK